MSLKRIFEASSWINKKRNRDFLALLLRVPPLCSSMLICPSVCQSPFLFYFLFHLSPSIFALFLVLLLFSLSFSLSPFFSPSFSFSLYFSLSPLFSPLSRSPFILALFLVISLIPALFLVLHPYLRPLFIFPPSHSPTFLVFAPRPSSMTPHTDTLTRAHKSAITPT